MTVSKLTVSRGADTHTVASIMVKLGAKPHLSLASLLFGKKVSNFTKFRNYMAPISIAATNQGQIWRATQLNLR